MSKKIVIVLILIVIALALAAVILTFYSPSQAGNSKLDDFAKCLALKNIVMYGTPWCEWCQKQEALFGRAFQFISFSDCSKNPQECVAKGINGTPTWIFPGGKKIQSYLTLEQLSQESGCELPK